MKLNFLNFGKFWFLFEFKKSRYSKKKIFFEKKLLEKINFFYLYFVERKT